MDQLVVLDRFGLAALFLVAGVAKPRDRGAFRSTLAEFGVPGCARDPRLGSSRGPACQ